MADCRFSNIFVCLLIVGKLCKAASGDARHMPDPTPKQEPQQAQTYKSYENGKIFGLQNEAGKPCLLAQFDGRLIIQKMGKHPKMVGEKVLFPDEFTVKGHCAQNLNSDALLYLKWGVDKGDTYELSLKFTAKHHLDKVRNTEQLVWLLNQTLLELTPADEAASPVVMSSNTSKVSGGVFAPIHQSFICRHSVNITVQNTSLDAEIVVQFAWPLQLQAFQVERGGFGNSFLCPRSKQAGILERLHNAWSVASGCILGVASMGTIIGYSAKRQLSPGKHEYETFQ